MNWQSETRAWGLAAAGLFCLCSIGYKVLTVPDLSATVAQLNGTLGNVNGATRAWSDASAQQVKSVAAIERDLRAEMWHVDRSLTTVDSTLTVAQGTIAGVRDTLTVTNEQLAHVGPLLDSARAVTASLDPVISNANGAVTDVRDFLTQPSLTALMVNTASMTASGAGILGDARTVADKETANFLKPVKWYMVPMKYTGEFIDIGAAIARHTP